MLASYVTSARRKHCGYTQQRSSTICQVTSHAESLVRGSLHAAPSQPLDSLKLFEKVNEVTEVLAECRFTPRSFCLDIKRVQITNIRRLLTLSSKISGRSWGSSSCVRAFYIFHHFPLPLLFTSSFISKAPRLASRHLRLNYVEMY